MRQIKRVAGLLTLPECFTFKVCSSKITTPQSWHCFTSQLLWSTYVNEYIFLFGKQ